MIDAPGDDGLWVYSDVAPDGTFVVTVSAGPDAAVTLDRDGAVAYAVALIDVAGRAEYDAAVLRQLGHAGLSEDATLPFVRELRADRPPPAATFGPLRFEPIVSHRTREPIVEIHVGEGPDRYGMSPDAARGHATHVLDVLAVADLDAAYLRRLRLTGLEDDRARAVVEDLGKHR